MFTGIVTDVGEVVAVKPRRGRLRRLRIACGYDPRLDRDRRLDRLLGVCLTVVATGEQDGNAWFAVDAAAETLRLTTVGAGGRHPRQSRARAEDRRRARRPYRQRPCRRPCRGRRPRGSARHGAASTLRAPRALARFIAAKGSVALDGVSLTVNDGRPRHVFGADHPAHARVTTLGALRAGDRGQSRGRPDGPLCGAAVGKRRAALRAR